jgi:hypothetical protein
MTPKTAFDSSSSAIPRQQGQTLESLSQGQIQHEVLLAPRGPFPNNFILLTENTYLTDYLSRLLLPGSGLFSPFAHP